MIVLLLLVLLLLLLLLGILSSSVDGDPELTSPMTEHGIG
jgi:hypothetical protein